MSHFGNTEKYALTQVLGAIFASQLYASLLSAFIFSKLLLKALTDEDLAHDYNWFFRISPLNFS
jgi:hypothetical protein